MSDDRDSLWNNEGMEKPGPGGPGQTGAVHQPGFPDGGPAPPDAAEGAVKAPDQPKGTDPPDAAEGAVKAPDQPKGTDPPDTPKGPVKTPDSPKPPAPPGADTAPTTGGGNAGQPPDGYGHRHELAVFGHTWRRTLEWLRRRRPGWRNAAVWAVAGLAIAGVLAMGWALWKSSTDDYQNIDERLELLEGHQSEIAADLADIRRALSALTGPAAATGEQNAATVCAPPPGLDPSQALGRVALGACMIQQGAALLAGQ